MKQPRIYKCVDCGRHFPTATTKHKCKGKFRRRDFNMERIEIPIIESTPGSGFDMTTAPDYYRNMFSDDADEMWAFGLEDIGDK